MLFHYSKHHWPNWIKVPSNGVIRFEYIGKWNHNTWLNLIGHSIATPTKSSTRRLQRATHPHPFPPRVYVRYMLVPWLLLFPQYFQFRLTYFILGKYFIYRSTVAFCVPEPRSEVLHTNALNYTCTCVYPRPYSVHVWFTDFQTKITDIARVRVDRWMVPLILLLTLLRVLYCCTPSCLGSGQPWMGTWLDQTWALTIYSNIWLVILYYWGICTMTINKE